MQVRFWGVRGSIPTPGEETRRWGGNSTCVEVRHPGHPPLVLDCGTGARRLGARLLAEGVRELDLLFTHLHLDHVFGLPFFPPAYDPGFHLRLVVPARSDDEARERIARYLDGVHHPIRLVDLPARISFRGAGSGARFEAGGFAVRAMALNHPGGALAWRVEADGESVALVTDTAPFAPPDRGVASGEAPTRAERGVIDFLEGCDLVVYDTMFSRGEYLRKRSWGHSYPEYAAAICRAAGVRDLVLFHHSPDADDDRLDALAAQWSTARCPRVMLAAEGHTLPAREGEVVDVSG